MNLGINFLKVAYFSFSNLSFLGKKKNKQTLSKFYYIKNQEVKLLTL